LDINIEFEVETQGKKTQGKNSTFGEQFLRLWHQVVLQKKACVNQIAETVE